MPRDIGIPNGLGLSPMHTTQMVGYVMDGQRARMNLSTYQVTALLIAGVKFKFTRKGTLSPTVVSATSSHTLIRELMCAQDLIWWGHTISASTVGAWTSQTLDIDLPLQEKLKDALAGEKRTALLDPNMVIRRALAGNDLSPGMAQFLLQDLKLKRPSAHANGYTTTEDGYVLPIPSTPDFTDLINSTENQENTDMSTNMIPAASLSTRAVQTKAGWVGQVMLGFEIVWESQPVPDTAELEDGQLPDSAAQTLAVDAIAEFYRSAFDEVTVKGFEAKAKGKK